MAKPRMTLREGIDKVFEHHGGVLHVQRIVAEVMKFGIGTENSVTFELCKMKKDGLVLNRREKRGIWTRYSSALASSGGKAPKQRSTSSDVAISPASAAQSAPRSVKRPNPTDRVIVAFLEKHPGVVSTKEVIRHVRGNDRAATKPHVYYRLDALKKAGVLEKRGRGACALTRRQEQDIAAPAETTVAPSSTIELTPSQRKVFDLLFKSAVPNGGTTMVVHDPLKIAMEVLGNQFEAADLLERMAERGFLSKSGGGSAWHGVRVIGPSESVRVVEVPESFFRAQINALRELIHEQRVRAAGAMQERLLLTQRVEQLSRDVSAYEREADKLHRQMETLQRHSSIITPIIASLPKLPLALPAPERPLSSDDGMMEAVAEGTFED